MLPLYRNQSIDLDRKPIAWFLNNGNIGTSWFNTVGSHRSGNDLRMVYNQRPPPLRYTFILETVLVYLKVIAWRQVSFLQTFAVTACNSVSTNLCIKDICPAGIYLLRVNNRNTRTRCEVCSKLTTKTPEWRQWRRSGVFIVNFEHIPHLLLVCLLLTLNI